MSKANEDPAPLAEGTQTKRHYEPPRLRFLGSVREVTFGKTGADGDGRGQVVGKSKGNSSRDFKMGIHYLTDDERRDVAAQVLGLRLATYDYKPEVGEAPGRHLGFIIEDAPSAPFVRPQERVVDVYGFAAGLAAALQEQQATIQRLEQELAELRSRSSKT